jgi:hypothetical protein
LGGMNRVRERLTYANVMSSLAVFLVLGGGAYAASKIGTNQIQTAAVTTKKLAANAVKSNKISNGGVAEVDIARRAVSTPKIADAAVTAEKLAPLEAVHLVGTPGNPPFGPGFSNLGQGFAPVGFYKDQFGIVHLQGVAAGPATGTVFALPDKYRPASVRYQNVGTGTPSSSGSPYVGRMSIDAAGNVTMFDGGGGFLSLEDIEFRAGS